MAHAADFLSSWGADSRLDVQTIERLWEEGLTSQEALVKLDREYVQSLGLNVQQQTLLNDALKTLVEREDRGQSNVAGKLLVLRLCCDIRF